MTYISISLGLTGFFLLWNFSSIYIALGVFLMIWGNNIK